MSELKACPFCDGSCVEISRYGNSKVSTFYQCNDCGVSLETGETFNHGAQWNNRPHENKLKADAVREAAAIFKSMTPTIAKIYGDKLFEHANKLERGEL